MESDIKKRIHELIVALGLNDRKFSLSLEFSESFSRNIKNSIGSDKISKILHIYPDINLYWLIDGQGEMFRNNSGTVIGDSNSLSGNNIIGHGAINNNTITIQAPPEGYEKIIKPDGTTIVQRVGLAENSQQIADLQDKVATMQATIDLQKETIKAQNVTIELLREKNK